MKRISHRLPVMVSGIFVSTLMAALAVFFLHNGGIGAAFVKGSGGAMAILQRPGETVSFLQGPGEAAPVKVPPEKGHWLKTADDSWYVPAAPESEGSKESSARSFGHIGQDFDSSSTVLQNKTAPVVHLEPAQTAQNRSADTLNIMYIWTDGDQLKVVSVTTFNRETKQASIVVIPLYTVIDNSGTVVLNAAEHNWEYNTIRDLYREKGREGVRRFLEQKLDLSIRNYVHVNQTALEKLSDIIGVLEVNGRKSSMLEAFEQTAAGIRTDDKDIIRAVACEIVHPRILARIPELLGIFSRDMKTDFTTAEMLGVFYLSRQMNLREMHKTALPGYRYETGETKYLFVSEQTWKNIIYEMTQ